MLTGSEQISVSIAHTHLLLDTIHIWIYTINIWIARITSMNLNQEILQQPLQFPHSSTKITTPESITALLNALFPEQAQEEKELKQVKAILGNLTQTLSIDEIHILITEIQYLVNFWLDTYEKEVFKGKSIKDILNEG